MTHTNNRRASFRTVQSSPCASGVERCARPSSRRESADRHWCVRRRSDDREESDAIVEEIYNDVVAKSKRHLSAAWVNDGPASKYLHVNIRNE